MDLTMILADLNHERRAALREQVRKLASRKDFTYRLFAVGKADAWKEIPQAAFPSQLCSWAVTSPVSFWVCALLLLLWFWLLSWDTSSLLSLCLIHLDYPDALTLGKKIYAASPFCRVVYYGNGIRNVTEFLPSRPVRYLDLTQGEHGIRHCLNEEYESLRNDRHYFHYEDRYQMISHPFSGLLYFFSRERMVYYQTPSGEGGPLRRTLDQVAQTLEQGCYLRCHKSYLVRRDLCTALDKTTRELILSDGCRIPVSRAYWKEIAGIFCENAAFTGEKSQLKDNCDDS